jgi:hypothetical protein
MAFADFRSSTTLAAGGGIVTVDDLAALLAGEMNELSRLIG